MTAKLLYIMAAGHSGSTLLDLLAGSIPGGFSTGELTYLPWQISRREASGPAASPQKLCSCGMGFHECPVWTRVVDTISEREGFDVYQDPFRFRINLLQNERYFSARLSTARILRSLYFLANRHRLMSPLRALYRTSLSRVIDNNWLLYDTISGLPGVKFVIDSSKSPCRLALLHSARPSDVSTIILFRDIRGVAYSASKLGKDPVRTARGWVRQYNRIYSVIQHLPGFRYLCLKYEDLARDPLQVRRKIAGFLGVDGADNELRINTDHYHLVAGNATRHKGQLEIVPDTAWNDALSGDILKQVSDIRRQLHPFWLRHLQRDEQDNQGTIL